MALSASPAEFTKFMEGETGKFEQLGEGGEARDRELMNTPRCRRALHGVRVLDFSHVIAGPFATFHLAQMGAQVQKVERPGGGDVMRRTASGLRAFTALNDGKELLEMRLRHARRAASEVLALAREADVLVDNYRPGVLERKGLGYDAVRARSTRVSCTARSRATATATRRARERGAYDHVIQALTGMTMLAGEEGDPPLKIGFPVVDAATGILGALAVVAALRERDRTGRGCFLDVSMWASALQLMYTFACDTLTTGQDIARVGNKGFSGSPAADTLHCRDGWLAIGANTPAQVARLLQVLGVPDDEDGVAARTRGRRRPALRPRARSAALPRAAGRAPGAARRRRVGATAQRRRCARRARAHAARVRAGGGGQRPAAAAGAGRGRGAGGDARAGLACATRGRGPALSDPSA